MIWDLKTGDSTISEEGTKSLLILRKAVLEALALVTPSSKIPKLYKVLNIQRCLYLLCEKWNEFLFPDKFSLFARHAPIHYMFTQKQPDLIKNLTNASYFHHKYTQILI